MASPLQKDSLPPPALPAMAPHRLKHAAPPCAPWCPLPAPFGCGAVMDRAEHSKRVLRGVESALTWLPQILPPFATFLPPLPPYLPPYFIYISIIYVYGGKVVCVLCVQTRTRAPAHVGRLIGGYSIYVVRGFFTTFYLNAFNVNVQGGGKTLYHLYHL